MKIRKWQTIVDKWIKEHGVRYFDVKTNSILLVEEVGELMRYIARVHGEQSFKKLSESKNAKANIKDEIGDIFFVLTCISNQLDLNLEEILENNIKKKTNRDKLRHKQNTKLKD